MNRGGLVSSGETALIVLRQVLIMNLLLLNMSAYLPLVGIISFDMSDMMAG